MKNAQILFISMLLAATVCTGCDKNPQDHQKPDVYDVYVAGYETKKEGYSVATVWKNEKTEALHNRLRANCVYVAGNDVLSASGRQRDGQSHEDLTLATTRQDL